jgi:predicted RNA binding protein YcfA (HicA-like mRNA interferase family)
LSKREKLRERLKNNPNNATFSEIRKLLKQEGFVLDRIAGSHHIFTKDDVTFVVPVHNNKVKTIYVRRVIELIEQTDDLTDGEKQP